MNNSNILGKEFFDRPVLEVAEGMLGRVLCRGGEGGVMRGVITEVEAYDGAEDRACHAFRGVTERTRVMFGAGGHWYVYLCYGVHWMLNVVTGPVGYPAAVLIRGVEGVSGPGRLTRGFGIDKSFNMMEVGFASGLWIEEGVVGEVKFEKTARIGVEYAGAVWANKDYRFLMKD